MASPSGRTLFLLNCFFIVITICIAQDCANSDFFGDSRPQDQNDAIDYNTGMGYMLTNNKFMIKCCGVTDRWQANFDNTASSTSGNVFFQIWRLVGGAYTLAGEFQFDLMGDGTRSRTVPTSQRVTIKPGDYIGWYSSGVDVIEYETGFWEVTGNYRVATGDPSVGDAYGWSSADLTGKRTYGVRLDVLISTMPYFTNLPATVSIVNTVASGTSLFTTTVTDDDPGDVASLVTSKTSNTKFSFDQATGIVTTAQIYSTSSTETVTFSVVDQCGRTRSRSLTVIITNEPPVIHNLPASVGLKEDQVNEKLLFTINATDSATAVTCSMSTTDPFTLKTVPGTSDYGIYSDYNPQFSYTTQRVYTMSAVCSDGDLTDTEIFTVNLIKNQAPVFNNLQGSVVISTSLGIGTNFFTVNVTDAESDTLSYTMTCVPATCPFNVFNSGGVHVNQDLTGHTIVGYDLYITVSDGRNTVGPEILTVTFSDINDPVQINNLPLSAPLSIPENTAIGHLLYTVSYQDLDTTQAHTFTMTSSPSDGTNFFSIDTSTGEIRTAGNTLNYESGTTSYTFTVTVADPVVSDSETLVVDVTNVNERPSFSQNSYSLSTQEQDSVTGGSIGTPSFVVTDEDIGDTHSYSVDCGASGGYFSIHQTSGDVSFQGAYNLDTGSLATSVTCTVTVTDSGGLTDTATLLINIDYANDNTPVFSPASYSYHISYYDPAGTILGSVTSTDGDVGSHGVQTYSLDQTSLTGQYFTINSNGTISLTVSPASTDLGSSTTITIVATASDVGGLSDNANVVIVIGGSTTTSTTTTTDRYRTFIEDNKNVAWLVGCIMVILTILGVLGYIMCSCRGRYGCAECRRTLNCKRRYKPKRRRSWDRYDSRSLGSRDIRLKSVKVHSLTNALSSVRVAPPPKGLQAWRID